MPSGYTVAGAETLMTIIDNFIKNKKNDFQDHFTREDISNFFGSVCNRFLHSYGQNFRGKKDYLTYNQKEAELALKLKNSGFFQLSEIIEDSGGFQASIGLISKSETKILLEKYYEFLVDYKDVYDQAFILDIPPGPGCKIFSNFKEVYDINLESYTIAANLPDDVRKKIIYIHHFRTPKLWDIYTKILRENDFYKYFTKTATGGIVANSAGDSTIPCIIYVLPLIPLLNETIKHKRKSLNFHVLGGATYRDLLFYAIFQKHVKKIHDIDLHITYDSSGLFKGLMIGRYFCALDNGQVKKVNLKTEKLNQKFSQNGITVHETVKNLLNGLATKYNFRQLPMTEIYSDTTGTFHEEIKVYLMLFMLEFYSEMEELLKNKIDEIYSIYESGDIRSFKEKLEQITININEGKISRKQKSKADSIVKSIEMLTSLDETYCQYVIKSCLSKDEFINLTERGGILTL